MIDSKSVICQKALSTLQIILYFALLLTTSLFLLVKESELSGKPKANRSSVIEA